MHTHYLLHYFPIFSPLCTKLKNSLHNIVFFTVLDRNELEADLKMAERQMQAMALVVHQMICDGELFNFKKLTIILVCLDLRKCPWQLKKKESMNEKNM